MTKVNGSIANPIPNFWWHEDSPQFDVLATDYGSGKGWRPYREYDFTLLYQTNRIKIDVDGETIFDLSGKFQEGHFGFYNYSQKNVIYSGFTQEETPAQSVPEPTSVLGLLTLGTLGVVSRLKRKR